MHGHLVTIEVGVEGLTHEWVQLDSLTFDEHGLERLDTETVKCWSTVQQHRVLLNHVAKHVPHLHTTPLDHTFCSLDVLCDIEIDESLHHKGLEELESHDLGETALVQPELGTNDDD